MQLLYTSVTNKATNVEQVWLLTNGSVHMGLTPNALNPSQLKGMSSIVKIDVFYNLRHQTVRIKLPKTKLEPVVPNKSGPDDAQFYCMHFTPYPINPKQTSTHFYKLYDNQSA